MGASHLFGPERPTLLNRCTILPLTKRLPSWGWATRQSMLNPNNPARPFMCKQVPTSR